MEVKYRVRHATGQRRQQRDIIADMHDPPPIVEFRTGLREPPVKQLVQTFDA
jgi:hypothetical protein